MTDLKNTLNKLKQNLNTLNEREAKYGGDAPIELLNQIEDHHSAIALTRQAISGELTEAEWREAMEPLLVSINRENVVINLTIHQTPEEPPFWRRLSRVNLVLGSVVGIIIIIGAVAAVLYVSGFFDTPPFEPAAEGETLIVIATFHETAASEAEPHVKIKRAIEKTAREAGFDALRVEIDPTELTADQREEAEALGQAYNASIVIWGEDTGVQTLVNFFNLKQPDFEAAAVEIDERQRSQIANPSAYAEFILNDLPGQITFLSFFAVGQSFLATGQYEQARDMIEQGINALTPEAAPEGLAEAYFRLGWLYSVPLPDAQRALNNYSQALRLNPEDARAYTNRGITYANLREYDKALTDFNEVLRLNPEDAEAYTNRGNTYDDLEEYDQALADHTEAIRLNPNLAGAYNNRGLTYKNLEEYEKELADYTEAIRLTPAYAAGYNNRGAAYANLGEYDKALTDFNEVLRLNPEEATAYYNRGLTYYRMGEYDKALADYTEAIRLNPANAEAYNNRGATYVDQREYDKALADFNEAIRLNPDLAVAYYGRGLVYAAQDSLDAAIAEFEQGLAVDTNPATRQWAQGRLEDFKFQRAIFGG